MLACLLACLPALFCFLLLLLLLLLLLQPGFAFPSVLSCLGMYSRHGDELASWFYLFYAHGIGALPASDSDLSLVRGGKK
ncbi:hypothetical protein FN846DRAFT_971184 [Sphaerosporella brunnea]|uniref:Secreted protein n=1 Tax=Sphaerosporella brunnea TaxID=1250544 RepID=A0A5J5EHC9_9PEZI|nr:hypothetical protein FN846DRAFT_971184 [Sphaerosporella brunnea]